MRAEPVLLAAGSALCLAALCTVLIAPAAALTGWLAAAVAAAALPTGALAFLLLMRLVPGSWGEAMRLSAEAAVLLTPATLLLFLPVLLGVRWIYPWAAAPPPGFRGALLAPVPFIVLALARFALVLVIGRRMRARRRTTATAAIGLLLLGFLTLPVSSQWLMSLAPDFTSGAFGLQFLARELVIAWSALLLLRLSVGRTPPQPGVLGGVLLALLVGWGYLAFMTFLVGWSSNLPEQVGWFAGRSGGWDAAEIAFSLLAALPAALLASDGIRRSPRRLRPLAVLTLIGQLVELGWTALPGTGAWGLVGYVAALAGIACLAAVALPRALRRRISERTS